MKRKLITYGIIITAAIVAIAWDLSTSLNNNVVEGTYRYESDFDAVTGATTQVAIVTSDNNGLSNPVSRDSELSYAQVEDMVRKAIELQGGLDGVVTAGDKVMIKPNIVEKNTPSGYGTNTDIRVVKALIKILNDHTSGDVEIMVAEGSPRYGYDDPTSSTSCWESSGYRDLLTDAYLAGINFSLLNLNQTYDDLEQVGLPAKKAFAAPHNGIYYIHKSELQADVYISVPVLKIHDTGITAALKNQIGTAPGAYYGYNKMGGTSYYGGLVHDVDHRRWTTEEIVDLCSLAGIDFAVVDAIMTLESNKTYNGSNQVRMNTIIAGVDPVAVDHVCSKLFYLNPDDIAHITLAEKVGIGTNDSAKIEVVGNSIISTRKKVKKNQDANGKFGQSNRTWILSQAYEGDDIDVEYIPNEASLVPYPEKDGWSKPIYFFDDRIDLKSYYNDQTNIVTYAFTHFTSPAAQTAELWFGCHDGFIIYLNGEQVYRSTLTMSYNEDKYTLTNRDIINIDLLKGENTLLVKTLNKTGDFSFALNICEVESDSRYAGNRVAGLKFFTKEEPTQINNPISNNEMIKISATPVPARYSTKITFELLETGDTYLCIYDMAGKLIMAEDFGELPSGKNIFLWDLKDDSYKKVSSGTYICTVNSGEYKNQIKLLVRD